MLSSSVGQRLITAFFAALELRHLAECEARLAELQQLTQQEPIYLGWCAYFEGILANERDLDWARAEQIFSDLLLAELQPPLRGRILLALGRTYDLQGRWLEAIQVCERSLPLFSQFDQPVDRAKAWKQIALAYYGGFTQADFGPEVLPKAVSYCQSALAALEPLADPDLDWLKGSLWNALGFIYVSLGQLNEAIACYQQDLTLCQAQDDRHGMGLTYGNLGEVYQKQGDFEAAELAYQQALALIREFKDHYEEIEALANLAFLYQEMGQVEPALAHYQQAIQLIEALRAGISSETAQTGYFATVADIYANKVLLCLATKQEALAFDTIEQARSRALLDLLAARSPHLWPENEARPLTLLEVQTALPEDSLLLEYFTTGLIETPAGQAAAGAQRHRFPSERTLLFAVTADTFQAFDLNLSPNKLRPQRLQSVVERHFLQPQTRRILYDQLIGPVEPLLIGKRRLYLVPHGPLHYIPFQALLAPDGETLLRENGPQLSYGSSATLLFRKADETEKAAELLAPFSCLALGYNGDEAYQLRFTEEEARRVAQVAGGRALTGPLPKKATLFREARYYQLLHLSCHGEFDPDNPLASALHLGPMETLTGLDVLDQLQLNCKLVILSACESGLSRVRRGDELIGLRRAFKYAGASALIATLWRVDERSTLILMEKFYRGVHEGLTFAEALKQAQLYLKQLSEVEALEILASSLALLTDGADPTQANPVELRQQAKAYLKQLGGRSEDDNPEPFSDRGDGRKIFADPFFWASFILVD